MLVVLFVALWFILRGDLFYVLPCVILFLCFSIFLALRLTRLGEGVVYLTSPGSPTDIGLQLGKACYPCSR